MAETENSHFRQSKDETHLLHFKGSGNKREILVADLNDLNDLKFKAMGSTPNYEVTWSQDGQHFLFASDNGMTEYDLAKSEGNQMLDPVTVSPQYMFQRTSGDRSIAFVKLQDDKLVLVMKPLAQPDGGAREWSLGTRTAEIRTGLTLDRWSEFLHVGGDGKGYLHYDTREGTLSQMEIPAFDSFLEQ